MKILLIDDHSLFRDGLELILKHLDDSVQLLNCCSYETAIPLIEDNPDLDIILLDLGLPGLSDIDALSALRETLPSTPVVVLSSNDHSEKIQQALNHGAQGYIPKSSRANLLIHALKLVLSGNIYIPPEVLARQRPHTYDRASTHNALIPLTSRQTDVLNKLVKGYSNKEIGKSLNMAESTVRVHIAAILKSLEANNRTQAVHVAIEKGWAHIAPQKK